ncbi:MAG: M48 family metalloprotease [Vampirovibrionales bacterium]
MHRAFTHWTCYTLGALMLLMGEGALGWSQTPYQANTQQYTRPTVVVSAGTQMVLPSSSSSTPVQGQISTVQPAIVPPALTGTPQEQGEQLLVHLLKSNGAPLSVVKSFKIDPEDTYNAATDGQNIIFTQKLWNGLTTNDQRAFVLAHELAHIQRNHIPKSIGNRIGLTLLGRAIMGRYQSSANAAAIGQATKVGLTLADLKFSRSAEYDADQGGLILMQRAGYNLQGALETLTFLEKASPASRPGFLMSHPLSRKRIEALAKQIAPATVPSSK